MQRSAADICYWYPTTLFKFCQCMSSILDNTFKVKGTTWWIFLQSSSEYAMLVTPAQLCFTESWEVSDEPQGNITAEQWTVLYIDFVLNTNAHVHTGPKSYILSRFFTKQNFKVWLVKTGIKYITISMTSSSSFTAEFRGNQTKG